MHGEKKEKPMSSQQRTARIGGVLYLSAAGAAGTVTYEKDASDGETRRGHFASAGMRA